VFFIVLLLVFKKQKMHKTKLISVLKSLTKTELSQFSDYVRSPFYNKNTLCVRLLDILLEAAPNYAPNLLDKQDLFARLFPGKAYNSSLRVIASLLLKLLQDFLILISLKQETFYEDYFLLKALQNRHQTTLFRQKLNQLQMAQETLCEDSSDYHYQQFLVKDLAVSFAKMQQQPVKKREKELIYRDVLKEFDFYSLLTKLRYSCVVLNDQKNKLGFNEIGISLDDLLAEASRAHHKDSVLIQLWTCLLNMLYKHKNNLEADASNFYVKTKLILTANTLHLTKEDESFVYNLLLNFCVKKIIADETEYRTDMFEMYREMAAKQLLQIDGYIPHRHFKNTITLAAQNELFEEAKQFIDAYGKQLQVPFRDSTLNFSLGTITFYQKKYDEALKFFLQVEVKNDIFYRIDCDTLVLRAYFEQTASKAFLSWLKSFKGFLKHNKSLPILRRKAYKNFILFMAALYRIKALHSTKSAAKIGEEIAAATNVVHKKWLLEKVAELIAISE